MTLAGARTYLLTGATGFLGKVALFELVRRKDELGIAQVVVVVRGRGARSALDRFRDDVVKSPCFSRLPDDWAHCVSVLDGDLSSADFGRRPGDGALLAPVTHVIHAAAAVSFTLPGPVAARANIATSLNLLEVVRACPLLERIVYVSTAYATPHREGLIPEELVRLPAPARELFETIRTRDSAAPSVLAATGHPNTYTLTKAIAEHLMAEGRGGVPLTIVRPSIITASREQPMPGWIDSSTGFGAFVTLIGLGHLRAIVGRADARLDLIPADDVAHTVIEESLGTAPGVQVRHAVAGRARAPTVHECWDEIDRHFRLNPVHRRPARRYLGPRDSAYVLADILHHRLPMALSGLRSKVRRRQASKLASRLAYLNDVFPYFTTRTFDFANRAQREEPFDGRALVANACRGVSRHLLGQRDDEWILAGRAHVPEHSDLRWVRRQPMGNFFVRLGIWLSSKTLRRVADAVTVDIPSFERARDAMPPGASVALLPSHRSFLDFVLCSYLAFARPDLGMRVPFVAAAVEFGRVPLLGQLLRSVQAFYVERGASRENRNLAERVHRLLDAGESIEFFVEGARSRTREFLAPKRGLLRCLESSGRTCLLLPIAISYDRIPEEAAFARELAGLPKGKMGLMPLVAWLLDAWRGRVRLGRMHIACGMPVILNGSTTAQQAGDDVIDALRDAMAVTSFHIESYLLHFPQPGVTADTLRAQVEQAGGRVLDSRLPADPSMSRAVARTLREQLAHRVALDPPVPIHPSDVAPAA